MSLDLCQLDAEALVRRYADRSLSPVEVCDAILERIARLNPALNAYFHVDAEGARAAARASERRWQLRQAAGPLDGVPISIKDHIPTAGMPSIFGLGCIDDAGPWLNDASVVTRLKESGALILGKTTMPEMGILSAGASSRYGSARNPWNLARTAGGSSGGAAAAVAAGLGPIAIGSDGGGSIRMPASWNGLFGLKPSGGRVPMTPSLGLNPVIGPLARSVRDAARVMEVITRPDTRDHYALPHQPIDFLRETSRGMRGAHIGVIRDMGFGEPLQPDVRECFEAAVKVLRTTTARVVDVEPVFDFDVYAETFPAAWPIFATLVRRVVGEKLECLLPEVRTIVESCLKVTMDEFVHASARLQEAMEKFVALQSRYEFLVSPTFTCTAFEAAHVHPPWARLDRFGYYYDHGCFVLMPNYCWLPACSIWCGNDTAGLPVGMQIIGRRYDDAGVLRVARAFEEARGDHPKWPEPVVG